MSIVREKERRCTTLCTILTSFLGILVVEIVAGEPMRQVDVVQKGQSHVLSAKAVISVPES